MIIQVSKLITPVSIEATDVSGLRQQENGQPRQRLRSASQQDDRSQENGSKMQVIVEQHQNNTLDIHTESTV